jgi:hypothetical protein
MPLIRYILIGIIGFLIIRSIVNFGKVGHSSSKIRQPEKKDKDQSKKISRKTGEYIDYEDIKK